MTLHIVAVTPWWSAEIVRQIFMHVKTPVMLAKCRGLHPTISEIIQHELRFRHAVFFSRLTSDIQGLLAIMRETNAIATSSAAFAFLTDTEHPYPFPFCVPYQSHQPFIHHLKYACGFLVESEKTIGHHTTPYCFASVSSTLGGLSRVFNLRRDNVRVVVGVTGDALTDGVCSVPVAFTGSTFLMNYLTADGFCSAYPSLTLRFRALLQLDRLTMPNTGIGFIWLVARYAWLGIDFRTSADNWDKDKFGLVRSCSRSWLAPCVERRFGDRGCLVVNFTTAFRYLIAVNTELTLDVLYGRGSPTL
ncbi:hypothetical protein C8Q76DRAFT_798812 [Earliella scabrosa]|nr:hypothetical protein C8Q76DRAFT_798812 [Earliella scabrosa]